MRKKHSKENRIDRPPLKTSIDLQEILERVLRYGFDDISPTREEWCHYQSVLADHLTAYAKGDIQEVRDGVAYLIGDALRDLSLGYPPLILQPHRKSGSQLRSYGATQAIRFAATYAKLVKSGRIKDRAPIKRIAECFDVPNRTVRRWVKEMSEEPIEKLWDSINFNQRMINILQQYLRTAGREYRELPGTRSFAAIRARRKKIKK